jgi:hypothetical protein
MYSASIADEFRIKNEAIRASALKFNDIVRADPICRSAIKKISKTLVEDVTLSGGYLFGPNDISGRNAVANVG